MTAFYTDVYDRGNFITLSGLSFFCSVFMITLGRVAAVNRRTGREILVDSRIGDNGC